MVFYKKVEGGGKDVVLIHGWGCDHFHMQPIADMLSKKYRVTNIDLPGRGKSSWDSSIKNIHDIADSILPHLPENAIYIGWSFGGLVSQSIAARYPSRTKRIIGVGTTPRFIEDKNWPGVPQPGFYVPFSEGINKIGLKEFLKNFFEAEFSEINPKPESYFTLLKHNEMAAPEVNLEILFKGMNICDTTDLRNEFKLLSCPIDLILGEKDGTIPIECHAQIKKLNPAVKIHLIPQAQHVMFWTHPELFKEKLDNCLK